MFTNIVIVLTVKSNETQMPSTLFTENSHDQKKNQFSATTSIG